MPPRREGRSRLVAITLPRGTVSHSLHRFVHGFQTAREGGQKRMYR
jgi:hypothetical protein